MNNFKSTSKLFILLLTVAGCQKSNDNTTTGNPVVSLAATSSASSATIATFKPSLLDLILPKAIAYPAPATLLDSAGNTVVIQSLWVNFGQIEFKFDEVHSGSEVDGDNIEFFGAHSIDLLSPAPTTFVSGPINVTQIRRIKLKLIRTSILPAGAPSGFLNKSIYIQGTVNGNSFTYSTQDETEIEIAGPQIVNATQNSTLLIELRIANLIKKSNLSAIVSTTNINESNRIPYSNPCNTINASASDLFTCFRSGFQTESNLGRDDDGNFQLDAGENTVK
ncbi:MAG: hypothetical protein H7235_00695 [Bdellovibrionaceae bacterium]|nr:hypothetical protein [Pseudobdellovibrionaceae bacterium]